MRVVTEGARRDDSSGKCPAEARRRRRARIQDQVTRGLLPGPAVACPRCRGDLIELEAIRQSAKRLPRISFWRADRRRLLTRCPSCKQFHMVFAYPLFNWIPPGRLTIEMALLNLLVGLMLLFAAKPNALAALLAL